MISARSTALLVLCAAAATGAALVSASASSTHPAAAPSVMRDAISMDQAVRMVEERYHARVVKAETEHDEGHTVYVLRLLNDAGRVWTVRVDPLDGSVQ